MVGLHFFNPAPVMALVEVVAPPLADPRVVARAVAIVTAWGKTPVICADRPGFIVNRVNRPYTIEALRILESGAATVSEIDAALREDGFPMGPFELMDLTGIDVTLAAATGVWEGLGRPDRLRPLADPGGSRRPPVTWGARQARVSTGTPTAKPIGEAEISTRSPARPSS